jgi:predicted secreted Zn-dependent protease
MAVMAVIMARMLMCMMMRAAHRFSCGAGVAQMPQCSKNRLQGAKTV